nr:hypothetical protein Iba_chr09eCG14460 [Ipomoea batatas]
MARENSLEPGETVRVGHLAYLLFSPISKKGISRFNHCHKSRVLTTVAERSVHMKKMMMQRDSESMGGVKKKVLSKSVGVYFKEQKEWFEYFVKVLLELPQD